MGEELYRAGTSSKCAIEYNSSKPVHKYRFMIFSEFTATFPAYFVGSFISVESLLFNGFLFKIVCKVL